MTRNLSTVRDVITRVALMEHPGSCECYICKAAMGDEEAFTRVLEDLEQIQQEEPNDSDRVLN